MFMNLEMAGVELHTALSDAHTRVCDIGLTGAFNQRDFDSIHSVVPLNCLL